MSRKDRENNQTLRNFKGPVLGNELDRRIKMKLEILNMITSRQFQNGSPNEMADALTIYFLRNEESNAKEIPKAEEAKP
jgi:hypothetical protein